MKIRSTALVKGFRQSAPYLHTHRGKTMVIMLNGEAIAADNFRNIVNDIALLNSLGIRIVLVFGARPQINASLELAGIVSQYHKGRRITDQVTLNYVKQSAGSVLLDLTARFSMGLNNTPMAGAKINVVSGNFVTAQPLGVVDGIDYCHSGRIRRVDVEGINQQLDQRAIVLVGPVASSVTGECFNLPSEEIATHIAIRLEADKLIGFCSEQGIVDAKGHTMPELLLTDAEDLLQSKRQQEASPSATSRFLEGAIAACKAGIPRCHLLSYHQDGALIQELFSYDGIGTQLAHAQVEQFRRATIDDIGGIISLIRPLEQDGILVRRSREQLEQEIENFILIEKDGLIIACAALYCFEQEKMAEMACVAVHTDYRTGCRGVQLLKYLAQHAKQQGIEQLFVLTTHSQHWFQEQGFVEIGLDQLPAKKQQLYNYQRRSKMLAIKL
ncbi:Amino-acid acetyltransferase [Vibrio stylophorae]|uniref:Amino-acid acetyltransferase n=1 Tax=Vibrio stylophorae TaxID=659351 RepID=A0ABM8ZVB1_9VIBR|nr:amino-acid N-acetyltransferase [Vibrio stylophorae]CAH0534265.1 Amino-acid acetyltransferase [Vibrio stylophorae]